MVPLSIVVSNQNIIILQYFNVFALAAKNVEYCYVKYGIKSGYPYLIGQPGQQVLDTRRMPDAPASGLYVPLV
jgi:hypothetical protein